jgi:hypothetical protein
LRFRAWHAACLALLAGCFYVKKIPEIDVNEPPVILSPADNPHTVPVTGDTVVLVVRATDPDDDDLTFEWPELDDVTFTQDVQKVGDFWFARIEILELDRLPSDAVTCLVLDGNRENVVTVVFELEFP